MALLKKLPAFSLVETIISMVIILTVITIAAISLSNVMDSNTSARQLKVISIVEQVLQETALNKTWYDEQFTLFEFEVVKKIETYDTEKKLAVITIEIYSPQGKIVQTFREIIMIHE